MGQNYNRTESQKTENEKSFLKKGVLGVFLRGVTTEKTERTFCRENFEKYFRSL